MQDKEETKMKKYQVRRCDEMGHDYEEKTFENMFDAWEFENHCYMYCKGWHFYTKEIEVDG